MSGLEVAGLVLGVIPLVVSALEHYAESARTIKAARNAARDFRAVAMKLEAENVIFRNTLANLLNDCADVSAAMLKLLMSDVAGSGWSSPEVNAALVTRLGTSYISFFEHVGSISAALGAFRDRLHLGVNGQVPFKDASSFREACKRFHFALQKSAYMNLIRDIKDDNNTLHKLADQTRTLQMPRESRVLPDFGKIRAGATSVFESLRRVLQVSCVAPHRASMYLGLSIDGSNAAANEPGQVDSSSFRVVLHHEVVNGKQKALAWSLQEAEIKPIEAGPTTLSHVTLTNQPMTASVQSPDPANNTQPALPTGLSEIQDLCGDLHSLRSLQCGRCLGYLEGQPSGSRHGLYWPEKRLMDQASLSIETLTNFLQGSHPRRYKWTNADARRLAVPLAAGVLRLADTPWLERTWNNGDITVIHQNGKILAEHPFLSGMLSGSTKPITPTSTTTLAALVIRNQTLFALGVVLIEMCMGKSMDELREPSELDADGKKHDLSDYQTACRLSNSREIDDTFGKRWSDVVRRCIYCDLNQAKTSLEDPDFQRAVYYGVFAELEEERRQFFGLGVGS